VAEEPKKEEVKKEEVKKPTASGSESVGVAFNPWVKKASADDI